MAHQQRFGAALVLASALIVAGAAGTAQAATTGNLLKNGSAQDGPSLYPWVRDSRYCAGSSHTFVVRRYTASDVPADGPRFGKRLFSGSNAAGDISPKCMLQVIDLRPYRVHINTGLALWTLSAYMGVGNDSDTDHIGSRACFWDINLDQIEHCKTGPYADGPSSDSLGLYTATAHVPAAARWVAIVFSAIDKPSDPAHPDFRNRGCFDEAKFTLKY